MPFRNVRVNPFPFGSPAMSSSNESSESNLVNGHQTNGEHLGANDLRKSAIQAANGDDIAFDQFFASIAPSAWGIAYAVTEHTEPAAEAVTAGVAATLKEVTDDAEAFDLHERLFANVRDAGLRLNESEQVTIDIGREPISPLGESQDRAATLAFAALDEPQRTGLWLTGAEHLSNERAGNVLSMATEEVDDMTDEARNAFRKYYLDSTRRDGLDPECVAALDRLGAYVDRSLNTEGVAATELHLVNCAQCRSVVLRISDVSTRIRAAIPPVPTWLEQHVRDERERNTATIVPIAGAAAGLGAATPALAGASAKSNALKAILAGLALLAALVTVALFWAQGHNSNLASNSKTTETTQGASANSTEAPSATTDAPSSPSSTPTPQNGAASTTTPNAIVPAPRSTTAAPSTTSVPRVPKSSSQNEPKQTSPSGAASNPAGSTASSGERSKPNEKQGELVRVIITTETTTETITTTCTYIPHSK